MSASSAVSRPIAASIAQVGRPAYTTAVLLLTDAFALLLSVAISFAVKSVFERNVGINGYLRLWPFLFVFLLAYAATGLYSGVGIGAPEELRRTTAASTVLFVCLAALTVSFRGAHSHITWTVGLAVILSVALVPLARECVRQLFAREPWWGYPAVVFGAGPTGSAVVKAALNEPGLGLKPIAVLDDSRFQREIHGVPVLSDGDLAPVLLYPPRPAYAVFAVHDIPRSELAPMLERHRANFSHIILIPETTDFANLWVRPSRVGGMLGLELRQHMQWHEQLSKRLVDVLFCLVGAVLAVPLCLAIAVLIRLDSRGPALYGQRRIGYKGRPFTAWKFRSMVRDADAVLEDCLHRNPKLRREWEREHKLKNDPRVTRIGRFLRKTSLDELPQLWNVLMGDMSLVGPRPIVDKEVVRYGRSFNLYTSVKGGITGLWQVSGRSDTSYEERVHLDTFYIRNWSLWLDYCILFRTIAVVLFRKGAY
ncbi:MAG: undecaprenyl-phosphate galactose phosphotransferase WbaP [Bryobacteraceae bacterium]|jgi:Undecaprenyl-phosphate galactose phosphotransferase WbaP